MEIEMEIVTGSKNGTGFHLLENTLLLAGLKFPIINKYELKSSLDCIEKEGFKLKKE